jgi:hypothetical protein
MGVLEQLIRLSIGHIRMVPWEVKGVCTRILRKPMKTIAKLSDPTLPIISLLFFIINLISTHPGNPCACGDPSAKHHYRTSRNVREMQVTLMNWRIY